MVVRPCRDESDPIAPAAEQRRAVEAGKLTDVEQKQLEYRRAWSRFATGVTIITTIEPNGTVHGMTANGVTSVSLDPPMALVCVGHSRNTYGLIKATGRYGMSVLAASQEHVAGHFTLPPENRPDTHSIRFSELGNSPVVEGAIAALDCRVIATHESGDHTIFVAEVESISVGEGEPLVWYEGRFGRFS